jgi:predicted transcriptional regulator
MYDRQVMSWTFLTNHAHVLVCLSRDPDLRLRDIAATVGITERAVHRIISELVEAGYLEVTREGRRNHYRVVPAGPMRHPVEAGTTVADLLRLVR